MKRKKEAMTYNNTLLEGKYYPYQEEREYYLECSNEIIRHYLKPEKGQNSIDIYGEVIEDFCNKLERAINTGKVHFAQYDGTSLIIKYKKGTTFFKDKFILTESAKENSLFIFFLSTLPFLQPKYKELVIEEKYTETLYATYYQKAPLPFEAQTSLDEFQEFYKSKLAILAKNKYHMYAGIEKKISSYLPNLLSLFLLDGILLACGTWYPFGMFCQIVTKMAFLFGKEFLTHEVFKVLSKFKVSSQIRKAIADNQGTIDALSLDKSLTETVGQEETKSLEEAKEKDEIVIEIENYIKKVEEAKYEGYQDHLAILNKLLDLYKKTENLVGPHFLARDAYSDIFKSLSDIEEEINRCLENQNLNSQDAYLSLPVSSSETQAAVATLNQPKSLKLKHNEKNVQN